MAGTVSSLQSFQFISDPTSRFNVLILFPQQHACSGGPGQTQQVGESRGQGREIGGKNFEPGREVGYLRISPVGDQSGTLAIVDWRREHTGDSEWTEIHVSRLGRFPNGDPEFHGDSPNGGFGQHI